MGAPGKQLKLACITLDLEAFGSDSNPKACRLLNDEKLFTRLATVLRKHRVKLTIFVAAKLLEEVPSAIERFASLDSEFELHSYSHNVADTDSHAEIEKAYNAYVNYFGKKPLGYRAPWGKISTEGLERLSKFGFKYDSSVWPSFRPGVFNNLRTSLTPFQYENNSLVEVPMAVVPKVRLVVSLSYLKFFGLRFYRSLFKACGLPNPLVFCMHLNDLQIDPETLARAELPRWVKYYHARNVKGAFDIFEAFLRILEDEGYQSAYMSEVYAKVATRTASLPS
jgi:hypothetical protein